MKHLCIRNVRTLRHRHVTTTISDVVMDARHIINKFLHIIRIYMALHESHIKSILSETTQHNFIIY